MTADLGYLYENVVAQAIKVKSAAINNHKSIDNFEVKCSKQVGEHLLLSQKDVGKIGTLKLKPIYMILFLLKICHNIKRSCAYILRMR